MERQEQVRNAVVGLIVLVALAIVPMGLHRVDEGHVGLYWWGGALLSKTQMTEPGYHWKWPITSFRNIQITMQTDQVRDIPCGTSGGVVILFDKIEVVNRLKKEMVYDTIKNYTINYDKTWIYDKIHHAINEFCSVHSLQEVVIEKFDQLDESLAKNLQRVCNVWAPGIEIIAIRVTKPRVPDSVRRNYELMEEERTKLLIADQKQKTQLEEAHTERKRAVIDAEKQLAVAKLTSEKLLAEKAREKELAAIEDEVHLARERAFADALLYQAQKEAAANHAMLTPEFLVLEQVRSLAANTELVFGDAVPRALYAASSPVNLRSNFGIANDGAASASSAGSSPTGTPLEPSS